MTGHGDKGPSHTSRHTSHEWTRDPERFNGRDGHVTGAATDAGSLTPHELDGPDVVPSIDTFHTSTTFIPLTSLETDSSVVESGWCLK